MSAARSEDSSPGPARDARLETLYREHGQFVWRALLRLGIPDAQRDDALQDVFLVVHRRLAEFREHGATRAWLFAIARRVAADMRRSFHRHEKRLCALVPDAPKHDPEDELACLEAVEFVEQFSATLDEEHRLVFHLKEIEGMSGPEIAGALDVNLNTVYTRLRAARRSFRHALEELRREDRRRVETDPEKGNAS